MKIYLLKRRLYCLIKKIGQVMAGAILSDIFLKTSQHNPLKYELINLYSYIGNGILMLYGSLYYQNKNYPLMLGYTYFSFPLIIKYYYENNNELSITLLTLLIIILITYNIETKIILYINILTNKVNNIESQIDNLIDHKLNIFYEYQIDKEFFEITNNKIVMLNILYLCFDIIKQHLLYVLIYFYLIDK
jgi:hypothetical protein